MAIIRFADRPFFTNPWRDFERMRRDMDALMRAAYGGAAPSPNAAVFPTLNMSEDDDAVYVRAELPGVTAGDLEISVENETLLIKGERKERPVEGKASFHRREMQYGAFSRAVTMPVRVETGKVAASLKNGMLEVTLPKAEEAKPKRLQIKVG